MRNLLLSILFLSQFAPALTQTTDTLLLGQVSYMSSQNVYVKFENTALIRIGDTLWTRSQETIGHPALVINNKSSVSVVGKPIAGVSIQVGDELIYSANQPKIVIPVEEVTKEIKKLPVVEKIPQEEEGVKQELYGRLSVASFTGMSNNNTDDRYRLRYTMSLDVDNIKGTPLTFEGYTVFTHRPGHWNEDYETWSDAFKIYNLALGADFNQVKAWAGRKINTNISSIGAIDGLQVEAQLKGFNLGLVGGSRPDYTNYGINLSLPEYGAFVAHNLSTDQGNMKNSLAFFEQRNHGAIDRRFAYFQHTNSLIRKVYLFMSGEFDLYRIADGQTSNSPRITSIYVSARYRPTKRLSIYGMYDARNNVIYYETYKDYVERLLEEATRQGLQLRINYRPFNLTNIGLSGGYRTRDGDLRPNINLRTYLNFSQLPWIKANLSLTGNVLQTNYLEGLVISARLSKNLLNHKLLTTLGYRFVDYTFTSTGSKLLQHSIETNLSYQFNRLTSFSVNYELNFESKYLYHRIYFNFVQRIKKY